MTRRRGKDRSLPSYNGTTATQRTVVIQLPEEKWAWLDSQTKEQAVSMRVLVSEILDSVITDAHVEAAKEAA